MGEGLIHDVENNIFPMLRKLKWRNTELDFNDVSSLVKSLDLIASETYLERSLDGLDVNTLKFIKINSPVLLKELKRDDVKLLWKACHT